MKGLLPLCFTAWTHCFAKGQVVLVQNNVSKLWNIHAKILAQCSHQGIETSSYLVRTSPPKADPDLSQDAHASAVLCTDDVSVSFQPSSILKRTVCEGEGSWLSLTQPGLALTMEGGAALSALQAAASPSSRPHTPRETAQRTRRVEVSPVLSILDPEGVERFELEDICLLERSKRASGFKYEVATETEATQALQNKVD